MFDTNVFQFRVANKMFGSNSKTTHSVAEVTCNRMGVNLVKYDDSDTSCHGYAGFFVKIELDNKVNAEEFLNIFKELCGNNELKWGENGDICLASDMWLSVGHNTVDIAKIIKGFI